MRNSKSGRPQFFSSLPTPYNAGNAYGRHDRYAITGKASYPQPTWWRLPAADLRQDAAATNKKAITRRNIMTKSLIEY